MKITVNGKETVLEAGCTVEALLREKGISPASVVAEHNGRILSKEDFAAVILSEGDVLEILRFVGGG